jgi:hypothetical protein
MFAPMIAFLREVLQDGNKGSFGRVIALPYFGSSLALILADGIYSLSRGESALDAGVMLASIGFALFTGSKLLSIKGRAITTGVDTQAPALTPPAPAKAVAVAAVEAQEVSTQQQAVEGDAG